MTIKENESYKRASCDGVITIFTPTYNRSDYIPRVAQMLEDQTNKNFVWILVNDGSSDDTDGVAKRLVDTASIPLMYISKENGGKHSAFKVALEACKTEFFMCMDDDDTYSNESVDFFLRKWDEIKKEGNLEDIGAIRTLTKRKDGSYVASFNLSQKDIGLEYDESTLVMNYILKKRMENWTCYKTENLRSIDLFSQDYWLSDKHHFFQESIWQGRFARMYKCRYIYISLRVYNEENISILRGKPSAQKRLDVFINSHLLLNEQFDYISKNKKNLIKYVFSSGVKRIKAGVKLKDQLSHSQHGGVKVLLILLYPMCIAYSPFYH